jgi:hypothetical protein
LGKTLFLIGIIFGFDFFVFNGLKAVVTDISSLRDYDLVLARKLETSQSRFKLAFNEK